MKGILRFVPFRFSYRLFPSFLCLLHVILLSFYIDVLYSSNYRIARSFFAEQRDRETKRQKERQWLIDVYWETAYRLGGLTSSECSLRSPRSTTGSKVPHINGNERIVFLSGCVRELTAEQSHRQESNKIARARPVGPKATISAREQKRYHS